MNIDILMITYNRPDYTRLSLTRLLETCDASMRVWIWHNGTHGPTLDVIRHLLNHPRLHTIHHSPDNRKLREPTNWFMREAPGPILAKIDDDLLMPNEWGSRMRTAHQYNSDVGVLGTWPFFPEDVNTRLAEQKVVALAGGESMMLNCWVGGNGVVVKRTLVDEIGGLRKDESFPHWMMRACARGYKVGWLYPFVIGENMDDPRSEHCAMKSDADVREHSWLSKTPDKQTLGDVLANIKRQADEVQREPYDIGQFLGPKAKLKRAVRKLRRVIHKLSHSVPARA